ncbi:MAG: dTMP kinase [Firmicutes bacterium]|nr:dTMP kinase [Bacillota bacterium]
MNNLKNKGHFITFEGTDGCGKSTQIRLLAEKLTAMGTEVLTTREPGGTGASERFREIILDPGLKLSPVTEALAYAAARVQLLDEVIRPAVAAGKTVLCDRYVDSSYAYQGYGRRLGYDFVHDIFMRTTDGYLPDVTFFLDVSPERAFERKGAKAFGDRMELQGAEFFEAVYAGYLEVAGRNLDRVVRIDASGAKADTHAAILEEFSKRCKTVS